MPDSIPIEVSGTSSPQTSTPQRDHYDVLVVGAGPSRAVATKELAQAGFSVVCLEQGDWAQRSEFRGATPEWELTAQRDWHPNPNVRRRPGDYPIDASDSDMNPLMYNGVGGGTVIYAGHWAPFVPSDFRTRTLDGVGDDWPLSWEELLPFYNRIADEIGVSGLDGDPAYPDSLTYPLPPLPIGRIGMKAAQGLDAMGWHWWPAANSIASKPWRHQNACVRRGTCLTGCPEGAKGSFDLTHWPDAVKAGAELITGARVREVTVNDRGLATGAAWVDRSGTERHTTADVVIVCANGIGTPRLLKISSSKRFPDGLANSSGLVGRRLMMHPLVIATAIYEDPLESWLGPAGQSVVSMEFFESDPSRGFRRGAKWQIMPSGGPLGLRAGYANSTVEAAWGDNFHRSLDRTFGHTVEWSAEVEDLPMDSNRVELSSTVFDDSGLPAPEIHYRLDDNTHRNLEFNAERLKEAMAASGALEHSEPILMRDAGWHIMGTARMGDDPSSSVVDKWGRSHDVDNLFIFDSSIFVTSSSSNPTATIASLALRNVERLIASRTQQAVPA
ncbi:MAG TPA: GMC family oxidoreductase [Gordonia polyisoprenivorans]|nr:GMC family oxidoreductase [Gordonia polyisoprenivorans]